MSILQILMKEHVSIVFLDGDDVVARWMRIDGSSVLGGESGNLYEPKASTFIYVRK